MGIYGSEDFRKYQVLSSIASLSTPSSGTLDARMTGHRAVSSKDSQLPWGLDKSQGDNEPNYCVSYCLDLSFII